MLAIEESQNLTLSNLPSLSLFTGSIPVGRAKILVLRWL